jgi:hypothetical protein
MDLLISFATNYNMVANALGGLFLAPIAFLPGWLSINIISAVLGALMLLILKYTPNRKEISRIRNDIKANVLAIKLFEANVAVAIKSQTRILLVSVRLLYLAKIPALVMIVPLGIIVPQMGMWFQNRPVSIDGDPVIVRMKVCPSVSDWPKITLGTHGQGQAIKNIVGPVRVPSQNEIIWKIKPVKTGYIPLTFRFNIESIEKQLAVGASFMRISQMRPGRDILDILRYPLEEPISRDSIVDSIRIDYPQRNSWMYGTNCWIFYLIITSIIFAMLFGRFLCTKERL